jgi:hypothetical protein
LVSDDLHELAGAPRHTELMDQVLVFPTCPETAWHARMITAPVDS